MTRISATHFQFISIHDASGSFSLSHKGRRLAKISARNGRWDTTWAKPIARELIPILSDHLQGHPKIQPVYHALELTPTPEEVLADNYVRYLLNFSLEYSLKENPPLLRPSETVLVRRTLLTCSMSIQPIVKKEFMLWLAWLRFRFGGQVRPVQFSLFVSLLPHFEARGYDFFREIATLIVALWGDKSYPHLVRWAETFQSLSHSLPATERDAILEKIMLEMSPPARLNLRGSNAVLKKLCDGMRERGWGGYTLRQRHPSGNSSTLLPPPHTSFPDSISLILSQSMIGLGDMALFIALARAIDVRHPSARKSYYLFQEKDLRKFEQLWPEGTKSLTTLKVGFSDTVQSCIAASDLAIYVTTPWSYQNGPNPVMAGPKGRTTFYLSGLDWNRSQGYTREYPDGRIEAFVPLGFSPDATANLFDLFPVDAVPAERIPGLDRLANYPKGIIYASYDPTVLTAALHLLQQVRKHYPKIAYFTFIRPDDFPNHALAEFRTLCDQEGIKYFQTADTPEIPDADCLLVNLGPIPQEHFRAMVAETTLPSLVTGTLTAYEFLRQRKLFFHLGSHPNAKTFKMEVEHSLLLAHWEGYLTQEEYQQLVLYFNLFGYHYQQPDTPFILSPFDLAPFLTRSFLTAYHRWIDFLNSPRFSFFRQFEDLLSSPQVIAKTIATHVIQDRPNETPTFETIYDDYPTTIWNKFRYAITRQELSPERGLYQLLKEYALSDVETAISALKGNPYRSQFNDLLAQAVTDYKNRA